MRCRAYKEDPSRPNCLKLPRPHTRSEPGECKFQEMEPSLRVTGQCVRPGVWLGFEC